MGRNAYLAEGFAFWCPQVPDLPVTVWTQLGYRLGSPDPRCQSCAGSGRRPRTIRLNPDGRYDYWQIRSFCGWFQREADILEREDESYQGLPADPEDEAGTIDALSERLRRALACPHPPLAERVCNHYPGPALEPAADRAHVSSWRGQRQDMGREGPSDAGYEHRRYGRHHWLPRMSVRRQNAAPVNASYASCVVSLV